LTLGCYSQKQTTNSYFFTAQYAGSIGLKSIGAGYQFWKEKGLASIHYGFVPKAYGGELNIAATKFTYRPLTYRVGANTQIHVMTVGAMVSYHFGEQFALRWPSNRYPKGYYWWSTALRPHLLFENSVDYSFEDRFLKKINFFLEANTNELYLVSYVKNTQSLRLSDIFKLGAGVRFYFRNGV